MHIDMLEDFVFPELDQMEDDVIFQQDEAPPHWGLLDQANGQEEVALHQHPPEAPI